MWEYGCFGSNIIVTPMLCMVIKCCKLGCCKFTTPKYTLTMVTMTMVYHFPLENTFEDAQLSDITSVKGLSKFALGELFVLPQTFG